jgi:hypothetical protein
MAEAAQPFGRLREGAHDTVGLRNPGVGDDHDSHVTTLASVDDDDMTAAPVIGV